MRFEDADASFARHILAACCIVVRYARRLLALSVCSGSVLTRNGLGDWLFLVRTRLRFGSD